MENMRKLYKRAFDPVGPSPQTREKISQIGAAAPAAPRRYVRRASRALAAAVLCAALATSALAASPTLRERLEHLLGGFAPYGQVAQEELFVTDHGVTMRLVSAMADQSMARIFVEFSGELGGEMEIGEMNPVRGFLHWDRDLDTDQTGGALLQVQCVDRDLEQGTFLVEYRQWASIPRENRIMTLSVDEISANLKGHRVEQQVEDIWIDLADSDTVDSETLETGETVLLPGQNPKQISGIEAAEISSLGFAEDGCLHILYQLQKGAVPQESHVYAELRNNSFAEGRQLYGSQEGQYSDLYTFFERDGQIFLDQKYYLTQDEIQGWGIAAFYAVFCDVERLQGDWELTFEVQQLPELEFRLTGETRWDGLQELHSLLLTPWSVQLMGAYKESIHDTPCQVLLQDGTTLALEGEHSYSLYPWDNWEEDLEVVGRWEFEQPVEIGQVAALQIGSRYIQLNGETGNIQPLS